MIILTTNPEVESQWFLIKPNRLPSGINPFTLGTVYHPPQNDKLWDSSESLFIRIGKDNEKDTRYLRPWEMA